MYAIEVVDLIKKYKNGVQALNGLQVFVKQGEIFSLLGQNGAGKSTLIKILTTYLKPTSGKVTILGKDLEKHTNDVRTEIACVFQQTSIDNYLSLEENMMFQSRLYKIPKVEAKERMETLITTFGLNQYRKYPVSSYSGGVKRRLDIASSLITNPKILFLDEPTVGMDIQSRMSMWEMMRKIRDEFGTTIFLTTHYLEEADNVSDTLCIMKNGKDVIQGTSSKLRSIIRQDSLQVQFTSKIIAQKYLLPFKEYFSNKSVLLKNTNISIHTQDMEKTIGFLLKHHIPCDGIQIVQPTLEDVFLYITTENEQEGKGCVS